MQKWLSILDYAGQTGKSISTLRRYIKSGKVQSKLENGKYFILAENKTSQLSNDLELELRKKEEEISELKMLVSIYESKLKKIEMPPELPKL